MNEETTTQPCGLLRFPASLRSWDWLLVGIVLLAIVLRLFRLHQVPAGFDTDEAFNMFDALRILKGARPVFLPDNAGREALYSYLQAGLVALLGPRVLALRLSSALVGIVTIPAAYLLVRQLRVPRPRSLALLTAGLLATSLYHLVFSRYGIRSITIPLFECLAFAFYWGAVRHEQRGPNPPHAANSAGTEGWGRPTLLKSAVAGLWLGLGMSAHPAGRILPLIPILFSLYLAWRNRPRALRYLGGLAVMLLVAALIFAPLGYYFWRHPSQFTGHPAEVTVVDLDAPGATLRALATNAVRVLAMFNLHGEEAWARNLSGRPVFDPLMGLFFLAGVVLLIRTALRRPRPPGEQDAAIFVFLWLGVMLLPTLLADRAPSFSRAIGILPVVFIPPATALLTAAEYVRDRAEHSVFSKRMARAQRAGPILATAVVTAALLVSGLWAVSDYFIVYANSPEMAYDYDQDKVDAANYIRRFDQQGMRVYLSPFLAHHPTVRFLTRDLELGTFDGERGLVLPPAEEKRAATYVFMPNWEPERAENFAAQLGSASQPRVIMDAHGRPLLTLYQLDPGQLPQADAPLVAMRGLGYDPHPVSAGAFAEGVELVGYALDQPLTPGLTSHLALFWRTGQPLSRDYTVFVHVLDDQDRRQAQHDRQPVGGTYPTHAWRVGELVVDPHSLAVDPAALGQLCIHVGLYLLETGERLPLRDFSGTHVELGCGAPEGTEGTR